GGGYGWFPLGWREPFVPWYGGSRNYFRQVNVTNTNITNITNVTNNYYNNPTNINRINYVNQRVPGAVAAVPASALASGRPVQSSLVKVDPNQLRNARIMAKPEVVPTRNAVLGPHAGANAPAPRGVMNRPVVTKMAPPPVRQSLPGQRGVVTENNRPGQPGMNTAKPGMNAPRPGMPGANSNVGNKPAVNTGGGNRPAMVNETKPVFAPNVHRPPSAGGAGNANTPGGMKPAGPANGGVNRNVQMNPNTPRGSEPSGVVNKTVQMNPNVPRPGEPGGHSNAASSPTMGNAPRPGGNVQEVPRPQGPATDAQPRNNVGGNVPRPGGQGAGYPQPGNVNPRVNESAGQNFPRSGGSNTGAVPRGGNASGGNTSGGRPSSGQSKGTQEKSTPKNEEHGRPQGSVYSVPRPGSSGVNAGSTSSARVPRPQPGQVRPSNSAGNRGGSYAASGQSTSARGSYGSRASTSSNQGYSNPSSRVYSSPSSGNRSYGSSAGSYS